MPERKYARSTVQDLEKLFSDNQSKIEALTPLLAELSHRRTSRAKALRKRVLKALTVFSNQPGK